MMKNEFMARAMTHIDSALIEEAEQTVDRKTFLSPRLIQGLARYGSVAACLLIVAGAIMLSSLRGPGVLLYGAEITEQARVINEYLPRAISFSLSDENATQTIPLELEFKRTTELTVEQGELVIIDGDGNEACRTSEYSASGKSSVCISLPEGTRRCVIKTDRGYNIVLELDTESGLWYVKIDKIKTKM